MNNTYNKTPKKVITYGPQLSEDVLAALQAYGHTTVLPDKSACVCFTPYHWSRMRQTLAVDETSYDAYLLMNKNGDVVEYGHAAIRLQEQFRKSFKARMARMSRMSRCTKNRGKHARIERPAQLPKGFW